MAGANTVDEDLANLNIMDDEEDPLMVLGGDDEEDYLYDLCLVGKVLTDSVVRLTLRNQPIEFGWDLSLRATPRKGGQVVSKWLQEENETDKWVRMKIDGERRGRVFGADIKNNGNHSDEMRTVGRPTRQPWVTKEKGRIDSSKQVTVRGEEVETEDLPVEFMDGKKRQRSYTEIGRGLMELGS
ncbi:hypothetical protein GOBAR_AA10161 [Gossypium barbadense]|uniref:Uncharacterized protein n=1 Tax=Gossypium barbadense TaxID=3634 RepID=A0A2P5Y4G8_GOSBA|nr:hypothetical protein GOBAR_AA10161 [Gossypium barbadense]